MFAEEVPVGTMADDDDSDQDVEVENANWAGKATQAIAPQHSFPFSPKDSRFVLINIMFTDVDNIILMFVRTVRSGWQIRLR